ncbi:MAG: DUF3179 domain-containing (seleno)protein [Dehalococcoidia bacterium]
MARRPLLLATAAALALLAAACAEREPASPPPAVTSPPAAATATQQSSTATPAPTAQLTLTAAQVLDLMRSAVCWNDDPALAASCLPPQATTIEAIEAMGRSGDRRFIAPLIDMRWLAVGWARWVDEALEALTGLPFDDPLDWYAWASTQAPQLPAGYAGWKGHLLSFIDPAYIDLLATETTPLSLSTLRPDLLIWAGAATNEVEPLRAPSLVHRVEERYLNAGDVVFALLLNGEARAYPRRIVAWHELVADEVDGDPVVIAFCRPCGGAVAFDPRVGEQRYTLGASGLVHDGRTLLFDEETGSLWDPTTGEPVAGPLLGEGIVLDRYPLVTTTWDDWATRHRNTFVLDLDTGFVRDYAPGAGLRDEPQSDKPEYPLTPSDRRLAAEERVIGVVIDGEARAYPAAALRERGILHDTLGETAVVLLSEGPGTAVRIYRSGGLEVEDLGEGDGGLIARGDDGGDGTRWFVQEDALVSVIDGRRYPSVLTTELYWFAWARARPSTTIWEP